RPAARLHAVSFPGLYSWGHLLATLLDEGIELIFGRPTTSEILLERGRQFRQCHSGIGIAVIAVRFMGVLLYQAANVLIHALSGFLGARSDECGRFGRKINCGRHDGLHHKSRWATVHS